MSYAGLVLTAVTSLAAAVALWTALILRDRSSRIPLRRLLLIVVVVGAVCRIAFSLVTPTFYAPDEQSHFNYVKYLYEHRSLPVLTSKTEGPTKNWEYHQPPLYYLCLTPAYSAVRTVTDNSHVHVVVLRLFSIALWAVNLAFVLKILDNLHIDDAFLRIFAVSMICLLPSYVFLSSTVNNCNLLITIGGAILFFLTKHVSFRHSALIGVLLGVACLTKLTSCIYIFAVAAMFAVLAAGKSLPPRSAFLHLLVSLAIAFSMALPLAVRNLNLYGSVTAESVANVRIGWPSAFHALRDTQEYIKESFWNAVGIHNNIRFLPKVGVHVTYFALIGLLWGVLSKGRQIRDILNSEGRDFALATGAAIAANLALVLRFGLLYGQGQGRFLFPMLIPIALLTAVGIRLLGVTNYSERAHVHAVGFFLTYAVSTVAYSFAMFARLCD